MPFAVYVLGTSIFALGTSEFMIAGLLPNVAGDVGVSVPDAGLLISAFAIGMVVGAPVLAAATLRLPRRATLVALLVVFALSHVAAASTHAYLPLFVCRVVGALACAGFWAVAAVTTISLVAADRRGRAMAILVGGLTVATVAGVPAGTFLGQHFGWRSAFWAVAAVATLALVGVLLFVPHVSHSGGKPRLRAELRVFRSGRVWLALGITALTQAMTFCTFSYFTPLLTDTSGLPADWVPAALGLFGVGGVVGLSIGGRLADRAPIATLYGGLAAAIVLFAGLAVGASSTAVAIVGSFTLGMAGFVINPALNVRVYALAGDAPTLASAANTSAFNVGNTVGPWLGGLVISAGFGYQSVTWDSLALGILALAAITLATALQRRGTPPQHAAAHPSAEPARTCS
jgi:DHA1 family chloramphenicol resistance protein-like MFS transporter